MLHDTYNRPLRDLRISVTDRCNFRCTYCMPLDEYEWLEKSEVLSFEEITRLARLFAQLGVSADAVLFEIADLAVDFLE